LSKFCLLEKLRYQLLSMLDKDLSIVRGWTFAKFFFEEKKMSSVGVLIEKKSKYFCEKREKKSKCPKKNFQSVKKKGEKKNISMKFRVFGKKKNWKESAGEKKNQSVFRVGVCVLNTLGRHVVKHG